MTGGGAAGERRHLQNEPDTTLAKGTHAKTITRKKAAAVDWTNERWVKLYTRDSVSWTLLSWQARCLLPLLMRRCDASGVVDFPRRVGATRSISRFVDVPEEVVAAALDDLEASDTVEVRESSLLLTNFVDAQDAVATPAERQRRKRERAKCKGGDSSVTRGHATSRGVTKREKREKRRDDDAAGARTRSKPHAENVGDAGDEVRATERSEPHQLPVLPHPDPPPTASSGLLLELDVVRREVESETGRRIGPLSRQIEHTGPGVQAALEECGGLEGLKSFVRWTAREAAAERIPEVHWRFMFKGDGLSVRLSEWRGATEGAERRQQGRQRAAQEVEDLRRRQEEEERTDGASVLAALAEKTKSPFLKRG